MWLTKRIKNHLKTLKIHHGQVCHATWPSRLIYFTRVLHMTTTTTLISQISTKKPKIPQISIRNPNNKKHSSPPPTQLFLEAQTRIEASFSTSSSVRRRAPMRCYCNQKPILVVSWASDNPGRRFYGCPNYWVNCLSGLYYIN